MSNHRHFNRTSPLALELYQPKPNVLYSLEGAAHWAGVTRRCILLYCRAGLVQPILQPPYGVLAFTEEAIHAIRRIEYVRRVHGMEIGCLKSLVDLLAEVQYLRARIQHTSPRRSYGDKTP